MSERSLAPVEPPENVRLQGISAPRLLPEFLERTLHGGMLPRLAVLTVEFLVDRIADLPFGVDDDGASAADVEEVAASVHGARLRHFADEIEDDAAIRRCPAADANRLHDRR